MGIAAKRRKVCNLEDVCNHDVNSNRFMIPLPCEVQEVANSENEEEQRTTKYQGGILGIDEGIFHSDGTFARGRRIYGDGVGAVFKGVFRDNKPFEGEGKVIFEDGGSFEGLIQKGQIVRGTRWYSGGGCDKGEFENGLLSQGHRFSEDGAFDFWGKFWKGIPLTGQGTITRRFERFQAGSEKLFDSHTDHFHGLLHNGLFMDGEQERIFKKSNGEIYSWRAKGRWFAEKKFLGTDYLQFSCSTILRYRY